MSYDPNAPELSVDEAIPSYSEESALRLFRRLRGPIEGIRNRDRVSLRDHLILSHAPLVEHCARGFASWGEPVEDLVQEGYVGLIKAVDRFDPEKGVQFSTYACHLIRGEMRHYLRDLGRLIHEPGWHSELRGRINRAGEQLAQRLGRTATPEEIASALEISPDVVREAQQKAQFLSVESLDEPMDADDDGSRTRADRLPDHAVPHDDMTEQQLLFVRALPELRPLEKRAVQMFFWEDKSKADIARELNISNNYAGYLVNKGVEALRRSVGEGILGEEEAREIAPEATPGQARAAYLLSLTRDVAGQSVLNERRKKSAPAAVPAVRARVTEWAEWSRSQDDEVARAARYGEEFGVGWFRIANWDDLAGKGEDERRRAMESLKALLRRGCRNVDKVGVLPPGTLPGLHFVALMPHCGPMGNIVGERWTRACEEALTEGKLVPQTRWAFGLFPQDGRTSEELLSELSAKVFG